MEDKRKQWENKVATMTPYSWAVLCNAYLKKNREDLIKMGNALRRAKHEERLYRAAGRMVGERANV